MLAVGVFPSPPPPPSPLKKKKPTFEGLLILMGNNDRETVFVVVVTVTYDGVARLSNYTYDPAFADLASPAAKAFAKKFCDDVSSKKLY